MCRTICQAGSQRCNQGWKRNLRHCRFTPSSHGPPREENAGESRFNAALIECWRLFCLEAAARETGPALTGTRRWRVIATGAPVSTMRSWKCYLPVWGCDWCSEAGFGGGEAAAGLWRVRVRCHLHLPAWSEMKAEEGQRGERQEADGG